MFKTKERDMDKANMKIEVLEWQLKWSIETQGAVNNERDSALDEARRLRKELQECKELESELEKEVDRLHLLLQERRHLEFGLGRDERKKLSDKLHRLQTDYDELMGVFMGSIRERDTLRTDKRNLEEANKGLELDIEGMKEGYCIHCHDGTKGAF